MADEKRMIGDWEVLQGIHIGDKEVLLMHDPNNAEATYAVCYRQTALGFLESTTEGVGSNDYLEMMEEFLHRVQGQIDGVRAGREQSNVPQEVLGKEHCLPSDGEEPDLHGRVVVMRPDVLRPEYRSAAHQVFYATHGFGASANARGSAIFGYNVLSGEQEKWCRPDVLGILDPAKAPEWVKPGVEAIRAQLKEKGSKPHERQ
jgi:hypothetical protein